LDSARPPALRYWLFSSDPFDHLAWANLRMRRRRTAARDLVVADWRTYNGSSIGWMSDDGVHLVRRGALRLVDYIARWIAHLEGRESP